MCGDLKLGGKKKISRGGTALQKNPSNNAAMPK
jgi:hypothetical protein